MVGASGFTTGAMSRAAGEYVPASSEDDIEKADLEKEKDELYFGSQSGYIEVYEKTASSSAC